MDISWKEISKDNLKYLDKVLEIYDKSFPLNVREDHDIFFQSLQYALTDNPNNFRILVGVDGEKVISFATGHYLAEVNTGFVVYIATNPLFRSNGVGRKTLLKIEELLKIDSTLAGNLALKAMILESESPEWAENVMEREECLKRNRFFQKNNYQQYLEVEYVQPPLHKDDKSVPLNLFLKVQKNVHLNKEEVMKIIHAIYHEKYYLVNNIDQEILIRCLNEMGIYREG